MRFTGFAPVDRNRMVAYVTSHIQYIRIKSLRVLSALLVLRDNVTRVVEDMLSYSRLTN